MFRRLHDNRTVHEIKFRVVTIKISCGRHKAAENSKHRMITVRWSYGALPMDVR